jgi:hypothetical protein
MGDKTSFTHAKLPPPNEAMLFVSFKYYEMDYFFGGKPPNPLGSLRSVMGDKTSLSQIKSLFAFFSGKRRAYSQTVSELEWLDKWLCL